MIFALETTSLGAFKESKFQERSLYKSFLRPMKLLLKTFSKYRLDEDNHIAALLALAVFI
ncbi:hypothetical protein GFS03_04970 [Sulfolobus sp. E5-1-F]|uniref:hypothetical protein n=1 Tax=Saccharolobus sp. E5-1-F TaxID=2663019 RepID=UPI001296F63D|nr:hypothetical protein [Sulfolobus sp. E5-1-F]QGA53974.1 hypothetical protein GFS03_04970 [Sulfolobus sp. E5-1-F]